MRRQYHGGASVVVRLANPFKETRMSATVIERSAAAENTTHPGKGAAPDRLLASLLALADVQLGGSRPWDIQLKHPDAAARILASGSLGFGESYMLGWWECAALDQCIARIMSSGIEEAAGRLSYIVQGLKVRWLNRQSGRRAWTVGATHYDLGNDFFEAMLDRSMAYSCGYWATADSLEAAQEAKLDLICRKLGLQPGMRMLDIGSGWGSLAKFAAERYGVECVGLTISKEQADFARDRCRDLPVQIVLSDYRTFVDPADRPFDRIASVGMFEHVGHKNYRGFFEFARRQLAPDGLFLLHTIGRHRDGVETDPWIDKYIFPNSELPRLQQIAEAAMGLFIVEDLHNFGADYDRTLLAWHARFEAAWPAFSGRYSEEFHRMWRYYLLAAAGMFRTRENALWQLVLSPQGVPNGYRRPA